jgi:hypothetical protein
MQELHQKIICFFGVEAMEIYGLNETEKITQKALPRSFLLA